MLQIIVKVVCQIYQLHDKSMLHLGTINKMFIVIIINIHVLCNEVNMYLLSLDNHIHTFCLVKAILVYCSDVHSA